MPDTEDPDVISRRAVLQALSCTLGVVVSEPTSAARPSLTPVTINNVQREIDVHPLTSLLDLLRNRVGLTGTKRGCEIGACGSCTVLLDGRRILSCLTPVASLAGRHVMTIEGLADGDVLHPLQQAFIDHDGLQCGFCTPGQILSALGMLNECGGRVPAPDEIRERMSGNLCRCGAYPNIVSAIVAYGE
jgi:xanthine dehydrogenase YagT iron-sulfur-binding subunit